MSESNPHMDNTPPVIHVAPSPHLSNTAMTTRKMMIDVLIALSPVVFMAIYVFQGYALKQMGICLGTCLFAEALFVKMRKKSLTLMDLSAAVTAIILPLSLPGTAP